MAQAAAEAAKIAAAETAAAISKTVATAANTGSEAAKIGAKTGLGAADAASQTAIGLTKISGEGTKVVAEQAFKGVGKLTGQSFDAATSIFGSIINSGKIVGDTIVTKINRDKELNNLKDYILKNGLDEYAKSKIIKNTNTVVDNSIKTLNDMNMNLQKALDDVYKNYRMLILCKGYELDMYYSDRGVIPAVFKQCDTVDNKNPVTTIEYLIKKIKNNLVNGSQDIQGFDKRISQLKILNNVMSVKLIKITNPETYDSYYNELSRRVEEILTVDNLLDYFNQLNSELILETEKFIEKLTNKTTGGRNRRTRQKNNKLSIKNKQKKIIIRSSRKKKKKLSRKI
jgi:hypothetical protein